MAVDAVVGERMIGFAESGGVWFVAGETTSGEVLQIVLGDVDVVASQTGHGGCEVAAALLEQFDLVAVNIEGRGWIGFGEIDLSSGRLGE